MPSVDRAAALNVVPNQSADAKGGDPVNYNENGECIFGYGYHVTRGRRAANEDRISITPCMNGNSSLNFYGVYDGHAGDKASELCCTEIPRLVLGAVLDKGGTLSELDALDVFKDVYKQVDGQLASSGVVDQGTTACNVLVCKDMLFVASTGDSQAVMCRAGLPVELHPIHKVSDARERNRVQASGGRIEMVDGVERVNGILNMSRSIGDAAFKAAGIICDPSVSTRQLTKGDEFLILATDGLWNFVDPQRACQVMSAAESADSAATTLVNLAMHHGSSDNVSVIVVDLRPLFGGIGFGRSKSGSAQPAAVFNIAQAVKSKADKILDNTDLFLLPLEHSGWLLKESRSGFLGKRWQKRFFVFQVVDEGLVSKDASVHNPGLSMKLFVIHYHESEEAARAQNPKKVICVDPGAGAMLDPAQDKPGRACFKLTEAATGDAFVLGGSTKDEAVQWVAMINKVFAKYGFEAEGASSPQGLQRTITEMESTDPNKAIGEDGELIDMPEGNFIGDSFTGPAQFMKRPDGGIAVVGGGWSLSAQELGEREMQSLVGLPLPGHVFNSAQAKACGVPEGSVLVR